MAENEVVFREYNERVQAGFDNLKKIAKEDGQETTYDTDTPLQFYCECSDENCRERVSLKPSHYDEIHRNRNHFVIICGHEMPEIERVVAREAEFCVVEKFRKPPDSASHLNATDVDNS